MIPSMLERTAGTAIIATQHESRRTRERLAMEPPEIIEVDNRRVACDGGNGALGHPRVFLEMGRETSIDCPYCGRRYVLKQGTRSPQGAH